MGLLERRERSAYADGLMPRPSLGAGPWGAAIQYWLDRRNANQAELAIATGLRPNTVSRAARGHHTTTRVLEVIAESLQVDLEEVLVSPQRRIALEDRRRVALEAAELAIQGHGRNLTSEKTIDPHVGLKQLPARPRRVAAERKKTLEEHAARLISELEQASPITKRRKQINRTVTRRDTNNKRRRT